MQLLANLSSFSESLLASQAVTNAQTLSNNCNCEDCKLTAFQTTTPKSVENLSDVANATIEVASQAALAGTFGVGGILIDNATGEIIHRMPNRVIERLRYTNNDGHQVEGESFPRDPTNHGERQMVSWYFQNRAERNLKPPHEYTIASSLDPCAMCSGSLITAGFNVAVIAPDSEAGTNWTDLADYPQLDYRLKAKLSEKFGYYGVSDLSGPRSIYHGNKELLFSGQLLRKDLYEENTNVFTRTLEEVRNSVANSGLAKANMLDPKSLSSNSNIRMALQKADPDALSVVLSKPFTEGSDYYQPNEMLYKLLKERYEVEHQLDSKVDNAVGLVDPFGNLLMIRADKFNRHLPSGETFEDPTNTAFMSLIQDYSDLRFKLISAISLQLDSKNGYKNTNEFRALTSPKYLTFVFLRGLSPGSTTTLKDLGAYGSSMEGTVKIGNFQFIEPPSQGSSKQFMEQIRSLPPLYGSAPPAYFFNLLPTQVPIESLDINVTSLADSGAKSLRQAIELANSEKLYRRILISTPGTIMLNSDLPEITQTIAIIGALNGSIPAVALNANGHSAIKLASSAIGTSIENLFIHGSIGKGIHLSGGWKVWNNSISVTNTILGKGINGNIDLNQGGGLTELHEGIDHYLDGWSGKNLSYDDYHLSNNLHVSSNVSGVIIRNDAGSQDKIKLIFEEVPIREDLRSVLVEISDLRAAATNAFLPLEVSPGFITKKGTFSFSNYLSSEGNSQGSIKEIKLSSGTYNVYALDSEGNRYALRELRSGANGIAMRLHQVNNSFKPTPDGKPISITLSLSSSGVNSTLQPGEVSMQISRLGFYKNTIAFYPVTDSLTGIVTLDGKHYSPTDQGYLIAALQLAKNHDTLIDSGLIPAYGYSANLSLEKLDPSVSHGLLLVVNGDQRNLFSSYASANPGGASQFMSIATGDGSLMFGVEDILSTSHASDRDFNDLLIQLSGYKMTGTY